MGRFFLQPSCEWIQRLVLCWYRQVHRTVKSIQGTLAFALSPNEGEVDSESFKRFDLSLMVQQDKEVSSLVNVTFPANSSPRPDRVALFARSQHIQQNIGQVAKELKKLDGKFGVDLDPAADRVTVSGTFLHSLGQKATGSVRFAEGNLTSLAVQTETGRSLEFRRLPAGASAFVDGKSVVVTTKDGTTKIEENAYYGIDRSIEGMRPQTPGEKALLLANRATQTSLAAAAGAIPGVGLIANAALASTGWASGDSRLVFGLLGGTSNLVGCGALLLNSCQFAQGISLYTSNTLIGALAVSALCAAGSAFLASEKR